MVTKELQAEDLHFMPAGNRTIKPSVVSKLKKSIINYGIIRSVVVVRTNIFGEGLNYYIVDGQHLFMACEALNVLSQLNIVVVKKRFNTIQELVEFVSVINTTQSPWKLTDFVEAYASTHTYFSYNKLKAKKMQYGLSYNLLAVLYSNQNKTLASESIKTGSFRMINEPKSDEITEWLMDLIPLFGRTNSSALSRLAHVFYDWYDKSVYDHEIFKRYVILNLGSFSTATEGEMKKLLNECKFIK